MTENTPEPETTHTPGPDEGTKPDEWTKERATSLVKDEVGKVTAKFSKKLDALTAELEAEKRKNLPDPEKVKAELADKEKAIAAKEQELLATKLESTKLRALLKAGADPDKIDALMKRVVGSNQEEIDADIAELKGLGFLDAKRSGLGTSTTTGTSTKAPTLTEQIMGLQAKLQDPAISKAEKRIFANQLVDLNTKAMLERAKATEK